MQFARTIVESRLPKTILNLASLGPDSILVAHLDPPGGRGFEFRAWVLRLRSSRCRPTHYMHPMSSINPT